MIFADKIILLRKKNGWSQEDLAAQIHVSRQVVAKWEGAQSVPSLDKILLLSQIFSVSTDYLLKDELEEAVFTEEEDAVRSVSLEEAHAYLNSRRPAAIRIAAATALCILSPAALIFLGAAWEYQALPVSENGAAGIGLIILLAMVALAVGVFIWNDQKEKPWKFLDAGDFSLDYGAKGMVEQQKEQFSRTALLYTILGTIFCILCPVPIFAALFLGDTFASACMVDVLLLMVTVGVVFLILAGTVKDGMDRLLQQGDFTRENRRKNRILEPVSGIYWLSATAVYLAWSFLTNDWENTWIVWPVAGVLFAAVLGIVNLYIDRKKDKAAS